MNWNWKEEKAMTPKDAAQRRRAKNIIFICGTPDGPYRYGGFYFEIHPYCGPSPLLPNGDPINKPAPPRFWKMWSVFSKLDQATRDLYAAE